jgi:branched-chain amino acid aminotransferase
MQVSSWRKFADTVLPTKAKAGGCYLNSALAKTEALANGYDDALLLDDNGYVVEASVANIFLVRRGQILMPQTGSAMLEGITRRTIVELLKAQNMDISETLIDRSMVYNADEFFITGTAAQLVHVISVDKRVISADGKPGPIYTQTKKLFDSLIAGEHALSANWIREW